MSKLLNRLSISASNITTSATNNLLIGRISQNSVVNPRIGILAIGTFNLATIRFIVVPTNAGVTPPTATGAYANAAYLENDAGTVISLTANANKTALIVSGIDSGEALDLYAEVVAGVTAPNLTIAVFTPN
jgi:hypothetical protein